MTPPERPLSRRRVLALGAGTVATVAIAGRLLPSDTIGRTSPDVDPADVYDPFRAGEPVPAGYFQVVGRDLIRPVYDPRFVAGTEIDWPGDADVIGVEIDGDARAYPVGFLTGREIVNDEVGGDPILVSW